MYNTYRTTIYSQYDNYNKAGDRMVKTNVNEMFTYYAVLNVTYYNQQTLHQFLKHFWFSYSYLGTSL